MKGRSLNFGHLFIHLKSEFLAIKLFDQEK